MVVEAFTHGVLARQSVNASDNLTKMSNKGPEAQRATGRVANFCSGAGAQSAERRVLSYDIATSASFLGARRWRYLLQKKTDRTAVRLKDDRMIIQPG
jgi:hypothetical protein